MDYIYGVFFLYELDEQKKQRAGKTRPHKFQYIPKKPRLERLSVSGTSIPQNQGIPMNDTFECIKEN